MVKCNFLPFIKPMFNKLVLSCFIHYFQLLHYNINIHKLINILYNQQYPNLIIDYWLVRTSKISSKLLLPESRTVSSHVTIAFFLVICSGTFLWISMHSSITLSLHSWKIKNWILKKIYFLKLNKDQKTLINRVFFTKKSIN